MQPEWNSSMWQRNILRSLFPPTIDKRQMSAMKKTNSRWAGQGACYSKPERGAGQRRKLRPALILCCLTCAPARKQAAQVRLKRGQELSEHSTHECRKAWSLWRSNRETEGYDRHDTQKTPKVPPIHNLSFARAWFWDSQTWDSFELSGHTQLIQSHESHPTAPYHEYHPTPAPRFCSNWVPWLVSKSRQG